VAEPEKSGVARWLTAAVALALAAVLVGGAALVWARRDRDDAQRDRARVERALASRRAGSRDELSAVRQEMTAVRPRLAALQTDLTQVDDLTHQDATLVQAVVDAGQKGDVAAYNQAVAQRNAVALKADAAQEKLRDDTNAVLDALARVTNRTGR
jgi:hypothetical protein